MAVLTVLSSFFCIVVSILYCQSVKALTALWVQKSFNYTRNHKLSLYEVNDLCYIDKDPISVCLMQVSLYILVKLSGFLMPTDQMPCFTYIKPDKGLI